MMHSCTQSITGSFHWFLRWKLSQKSPSNNHMNRKQIQGQKVSPVLNVKFASEKLGKTG